MKLFIHNTWLSAFTVVLSGSLLHCGPLEDASPASLAEKPQNAVDENALKSGELLLRSEPELLEAERFEREPVKDVPDEEPQTKANWNVGANPVPGSTSITVWWDAQPNLTYTVCWKETGKIGAVCWYNEPFEVTAGESNFYYGVQYAGIHNLKCDTEYKVRVKLGLSGDTTTVTTAACGCTEPCPQGGWYDGANCQIGQAPAGTTAFIWGGNYYYSALAGNQCPYPGSWYDGANCFVQAVPAGVTPFIYANHWYYQACP